MNLSGKTALVTGASSGMGFAIAEQLQQAGARVFGLCRNISKIPAAVHPISCDLTSPEQIDAAFASLDALDILINNAGIAILSGISDGDPADWQKMWQVNVHALATCCQKSLALFPESGGQIVNISSMSGHRVPRTGGFYAPTKFAVRAISDALRTELRSQDNPTRVACVSPGFVDTPLLDVYFKGREQQLEETKTSMDMLTAEDVAESVMHILRTPAHVDVSDIMLRCTQQKI
ncbi:SDR family oxidoreductase [Verrucomicrobiaceae bacterium R5-34]|uniref:SDR family oxidoreductase n=1 Tax=Oceaniferula flava TaxID=2800421 RepID=A0AAE2SF62_9BACT|nr:SDR family oxidoreductase [Oceaniferula flavus]MBK1832140.1 SDR family oxidoreductase [Verrucomicrobiaceae bacterium R5-34]MBK1856252.1 SDR family oxidoreductase [Oceaniferula flavus]MBM1137559.1 SDR family oxidoreductase [Oceaniferula flavus]